VSFRIYGAKTQSDLMGQVRGEIIGSISEADVQDPGEIQRFSSLVTNTNLLYFAVQPFTSASPFPVITNLNHIEYFYVNELY